MQEIFARNADLELHFCKSALLTNNLWLSLVSSSSEYTCVFHAGPIHFQETLSSSLPPCITELDFTKV